MQPQDSPRRLQEDTWKPSGSLPSPFPALCPLQESCSPADVGFEQSHSLAEAVLEWVPSDAVWLTQSRAVGWGVRVVAHAVGRSPAPCPLTPGAPPAGRSLLGCHPLTRSPGDQGDLPVLCSDLSSPKGLGKEVCSGQLQL